MQALMAIPDEQRAAYADHAAALMGMAFQAQGATAFESTKRCAAIHEAGHCVVNTLVASPMMWPPTMTRIWREPIKGLTVWLGETRPAKNAPRCAFDVRVDPYAYQAFAVSQLGGVVSEMLFDAADYRIGSSVDELVIAAGGAKSLAAVGLFETADSAFGALLNITSQMLICNRDVVQAIAERLQASRRVQGAELTNLLARIA